MKKGFITIASGDERYYRMARTLLRSYRQNCEFPMPFAVIADRQNEYTAEFDDIVILENPTRSWMDKMELLKSCPYEENIFIDADCLVYRDINFLWALFEHADDFSCFGSVLPMDAKDGWFTSEVAKLYPIHFITHLHGMLYFIRKGAVIDQMAEQCQKIIRDYHSVSYKAFNDVLADEPVFALAMAIMDLKPIERRPEYYCFVPFSTKLSTNYYRKRVSFENPKDGYVKECCIVHWGNANTKKCQYRFDAHVVDRFVEDAHRPFESLYRWFFYGGKILYFRYWIEDKWTQARQWMQWFFGRVRVKLTRQE